ncbi:MAG: hypothetical protein R2880_17895 [Deinococcales bacterium]
MSEEALKGYVRELYAEISKAHQGKGDLPFRHGSFWVSAISRDMEMDITHVSEEDAIIIVSELQALGIRAVMRAMMNCPNCKKAIPKQDYCLYCRKKLEIVDELEDLLGSDEFRD